MKIRKKIILIFIVAFILGTFVITITYEFLNNNYNNKTYYAKSDNIDGSIENILVNDYINVDLSGNINKYCIKTTRTKPTQKSLCWNSANNKLKISYIKGKVYYLWIMDNNNNISSNYTKIPT